MRRRGWSCAPKAEASRDCPVSHFAPAPPILALASRRRSAGHESETSVRYLFPRPVQPRAIALGLTLALHLALLLTLLLWRSPALILDPEPLLVVSLSDISGDGEDAAAAAAAAAPSAPELMPPVPPVVGPPDAPPPPLVEIPSLAEPIDVAAMEPDFTSEPDPEATGDAPMMGTAGVGTGAAGSACPLLAAVRADLERDAAARAALSRIPKRSLSVASAILLWDGRWVEPRFVGGPAPVRAVRAAIGNSLRAASQACRDEMILGPVFLPVDTGAGTLVLALGSGAWRWQDLLRESSQISNARPKKDSNS